MENPVDKYSADIDGYYEYTRLFTAIARTLGEGYALHKQESVEYKSSWALSFLASVTSGEINLSDSES